MHIYGKIKVKAVLPDKLKRLEDIAQDLWWSWNPEAIDLYRDINLDLWENLNKNPVRFLQEVSHDRLIKKLDEPYFMEMYSNVINKYDSYLSNKNTWFSEKYPDKSNHMVAYFSAEYGLNEVLPIYSGGLGVLSGDHCKSASDLGIPFTAIGLFYKQGYFNQRINYDGWQESAYSELNVSQLPISPVLDDKGKQQLISLEFPGRLIYAKIWRVKVGRIFLYLMDTDTEKNNEHDRMLTSQLYGGDQETRIQQEIILGMGGMKLLDLLNINPTVYHMNEGHSAFMGLMLIKKLMEEKKLSFKAAKEVASSSMAFTTHTPVPAGNDMFPQHMIDKYFSNFWEKIGIGRDEFLNLGFKAGDNQNFNMTILALKLSGKKNGVSELHGAVTRNIFNNLWPEIPECEIPVHHITNGIHTLTWLSPDLKKLYSKYLDTNWEDNIYKKETWELIDNIPDEELWNTHFNLKKKMIHFIRDRLKQQRKVNGESLESIEEVDNFLDPNALTIGFARRFATYKRANLIFRDIERIKKLFNAPDMPIQIIFAGKAHPADRPAQEVIKNINDIAKQEGFVGKVVLIENYNMTLARKLVQGVDIWLNNPRRPLEASGTSGQKAAVNGVINFSILDGWWCEGYNGENGWAIGDETTYKNESTQDNVDSEAIYKTLEQIIVPLYFDRNEKNIPINWVAIMKKSIESISYQYSTNRMVQDYTEKMYLPLMERVDIIIASNYNYVYELSNWKLNIEKSWGQVEIISEDTTKQLREYNSLSGEIITITTSVRLGSISPSEVKVQLYYGVTDANGCISNPKFEDMELVDKTDDSSVYRYTSQISFVDGGEYSYTFRMFPYNTELINEFDTGLIRWVVAE